MSLDFQNAFNPRDSEFLDFLRDKGTVPGSMVKLSPTRLLDSMNMADQGLRSEPGSQQFTVEQACRLHCSLIENWVVVGKFTAVVPARAVVDINSITRLGIRRTSQSHHAQAISQAFFDYNHSVHGPLPSYVAKVASQSGAPLSDYGMFFEHECTLQSRIYDAQSLGDWIRKYFKSNEKPIGFRIESVEWLSDYPTPAQGPNNLRPPSLAGAEQAVIDAYDQEVQKTDCAGIVTKIAPIKIEQLRLPDEIKIEWAWEYIELGCGGGFHFYKPTTYYREANAVLYAVGAYPGNLDGVKKKIIQIIEESAKAAAFYALVSGDIQMGLTVFNELFVQKIKEAFVEVQKCLSAEIYVVTETGQWHT